MTRVLCTFPGRYGDLLWALPTVRAVAETVGDAVDLQIAGEFSSITDLLAQQPYLRQVYAHDDWSLSQPTPVPTPEGYDRVFHLGYDGWPLEPLPQHIYRQLQTAWLTDLPTLAPLVLGRPWITVQGSGAPTELAIGFTEAWFELKLGLACALERLLPDPPRLYLTPEGSRWTTEVPYGMLSIHPCSWWQAAATIRNADLFFGDCSALHVLACALGKTVILCEPMEGRHNDIFYPYGKLGPEVTLVLGNDGKPTFDARACAEALRGR